MRKIYVICVCAYQLRSRFEYLRIALAAELTRHAFRVYESLTDSLRVNVSAGCIRYSLPIYQLRHVLLVVQEHCIHVHAYTRTRRRY